MKGDRPEVLIIGGGTTGVGIARDLAMRGAEVLLAEAGDFATGASGANHGMLHSGARYAVGDGPSARECASENKILKRIASFCVEDVGGLFVSLPGEDEVYPSLFLRSCASAGVEAKELTISEALDREPNITGQITAAAEVPDAALDPFFLTWGNVMSARQEGATVLNHSPVRSMTVVDGQISSVLIGEGKDQRTVRPEVIVNAAGAWCGRIAAMASLDLPVQIDKGTMVVFNGRIVNGLVNRLRPPSDGDILVPHRTSTILGTTSGEGDVDRTFASRQEVRSLVQQAREVLPSIGEARMVRAYAGTRPLLAGGGLGRGASRGFRIIDHAPAVDNMISVLGGKLTTYRLMAEKASDDVIERLGRKAPCRTMVKELVPPGKDKANAFHYHAARSRYGSLADNVLASPSYEEVCSCEAVSRAELEHFAGSGDVRDLSDLLRRTRAGMGYCQAGSCAFGMAAALDGAPLARTEEFLRARWKGIEPVLEGEQLVQEAFKAHLYRVYGVDHTSGGSE